MTSCSITLLCVAVHLRLCETGETLLARSDRTARSISRAHYHSRKRKVSATSCARQVNSAAKAGCRLLCRLQVNPLPPPFLFRLGLLCAHAAARGGTCRGSRLARACSAGAPQGRRDRSGQRCRRGAIGVPSRAGSAPPVPDLPQLSFV